jgi:hypothetical protein
MFIQEELTINFSTPDFIKISFLDLWRNIPEVLNLINGSYCDIKVFLNKFKND